MSDWEEAVSLLQQACRDAFGVPVVFLPSLRNHPELGGQSIDVTGILDDRRETIPILGSGDVEVITPRTTLELRPADFGFDPMEGDEVVFHDISFRIRDVLMDGLGSALLTLDRL